MDISLNSLKKPISHFLNRYHVVIFVVTILGGLGAAIFLLYGTVALSSESNGYVSSAGSTTFDKQTIDRVNQLKSRDQNKTSIDFGKGRTNPFVE